MGPSVFWVRGSLKPYLTPGRTRMLLSADQTPRTSCTTQSHRLTSGDGSQCATHPGTSTHAPHALHAHRPSSQARLQRRGLSLRFLLSSVMGGTQSPLFGVRASSWLLMDWLKAPWEMPSLCKFQTVFQALADSGYKCQSDVRWRCCRAREVGGVERVLGC